MAELPAFKARPEWVFPVLSRITQHQGDYRAMEDAIFAWWQTQSSMTKKPFPRNSLRAVFGPTLRHLGFVRGAGDQISVTPRGVRILDAGARGTTSLKKELAAQLARLDRDTWVGLLPYLQVKAGQVEVGTITEHLAAKYQTLTVDRQKVSKYIGYMAYAGLVSTSPSGVEIRTAQYEAALTRAWKHKPSATKFARALNEAYNRAARGSVYVPIPIVRNRVCRDLGIWDEEFDELLIAMPKESSGRIVQLSAPMERTAGGLRVGGSYMYYMAIYDRTERHA